MGLSLPLGLFSFNVIASKDWIKYRWETATIDENIQNAIRRSSNPKDWVKLSQIQGSEGEGNHTYTHFNEHPLTGFSYYRLVKTDRKGEKKSAIRIGQVGSAFQVNMYTNPTLEKLFVSTNHKDEIIIYLFGRMGKEI